ncbi:MAG: diguanylate cyclase [Acidobacteria bacterium]|nr:diguanylate cyclase [Acidobacteriota bacterium]
MTEPTPVELAKIAEDSALAAVVVDENSSVRSSANNNSICEVLNASDEFAPSCAEFCGRAVEFAGDDRGSYRCFAGLDCVAVRMRTSKPSVAIVGRAFTSAENYRRATERAISGDWSKFPPTKIFDNVLLTSSEKNIEDAALKIQALGVAEDRPFEPSPVETPAESETIEIPVEEGGAAVETPFAATAEAREPVDEENPPEIGSDQIESGKTPPTESEATAPIPRPVEEMPDTAESDQKSAIEQMLREFNEKPPEIVAVSGPPTADAEEFAAWRSFFGSLASLKYRDACDSILEFLQRRYGLASLGWLELRERGFEVISATGTLEKQQFKVHFQSDDRRLFRAIEAEAPLRLRERTRSGGDTERKTVALYPIAVGDEVQNALVVADAVEDEYLMQHLSRFCHSVASEIEVLRLREEVKRRSWLAKAVERFNSGLKDLDTDEFWPKLIQISAELMNSERSSLLLFDEKTDIISVRAAIGATAESIESKVEGIGERVARGVLTEGKPVVIGDVGKIGIGAAPLDWKYKTGSFISYPFVIGNRRIGVLNFADKADGTAYNEFDLEILEAIAPQVAVVIDRAALKSKAGEFEQLSVTDPLTGLLNRRYLEERLAEEIKRSNRYGYPMCFLMVDVDDFGKFNKDFGVLVGDRVLREAVDAMKGTLRGADIAARYGGEEFCVLLPQTTLAEARMIAERIRHSVESIEFPQRKITISVGISTFVYGISSAEEIIRAADEAMRQAKAKGKNNVQVHESSEAAAE